MKGNKDEKENIQRQFRELLGMPDLSDEGLTKIISHLMQVGQLLYENYIESFGKNKSVAGFKKNKDQI